MNLTLLFIKTWISLNVAHCLAGIGSGDVGTWRRNMKEVAHLVWSFHYQMGYVRFVHILVKKHKNKKTPEKHLSPSPLQVIDHNIDPSNPSQLHWTTHSGVWTQRQDWWRRYLDLMDSIPNLTTLYGISMNKVHLNHSWGKEEGSTPFSLFTRRILHVNPINYI